MTFVGVTMKYVSMVLIFSLIFISCSSNTWIKKLPLHQKYEKEINYLGENRSGRILLINKTEIQTETIHIKGDSLYYRLMPETPQVGISLYDVKEVRFKDHLVGVFYGFMGGLGIGVATGYVSIDWDTEMAGLGMLLYMGVGILVGSITEA